jgi:hypothetical protein
MTNRRNNPELEYNSDDMSAGARLMRYYVSDEPRHIITMDKSGSSTSSIESHQPTTILSEAQDISINSIAAASSTEEAESIVDSAVEDESKDIEDKDSDNDETGDTGNIGDTGDSDDTIFRRDLVSFRGDVLFAIVGRYSHQDILKKITKFHPQAKFGQRQLTWRIANAIKSRAIRYGVTKGEVRAELDAMRIANGVEFPKNYRPKGQRQPGEPGKDDATPSDDNGDETI